MFPQAILLAALAAAGCDAASAPPEPSPSRSTPAAQDLATSADTICFQTWIGGAEAPQDGVRLTATGTDAVSGLVLRVTYSAGQPDGWLSATLTETATPAQLWLSALRGSLPAGAYGARVEVSAPGIATRVIDVSYRVDDPGSMALVTTELGGFTTFDLSPGTGTIAGPATTCRGRCTIAVPPGTSLTLEATPDPDNFFLYWQGSCANERTPSCSFAVTGNVTVQAYFALQGYGVGVAMRGEGANGTVISGSLVGQPLLCTLENGVQGGICGGNQGYGARLTVLEAYPGAGSEFVGWNGDCEREGRQCTLQPNPGGSRGATATFRKTGT